MGRPSASHSAAGPSLAETASLADAFRAMVRLFPDNTAVKDESRALTYAELDVASDRIAAGLRTRAARGELVGVVIDRSLGTPVALLGVLKAGCAYVPLDPAYPEHRLRHIGEDCGLRVVVGDPVTVRDCGLDNLEVVDPAACGDGGRPSVEERITADCPAYVIYTSGSTGRPKGCVVSHGNVLALMRHALPLFDFRTSDRWTLFHSTSFDFSVWELWGALLTGGTAICVSAETAREPEEFLQLLERERVTVLNQVPSAFRALCRMCVALAPDLSLRYVIFGGESLDLDVVGEFVRYTAPRSPVMVNMYGITETTVHSTIKVLTEPDMESKGRASIGRPLPHVVISLRDKDMLPVKPGEAGEMYIAGSGVATGYLNRPELTAERFLTLDTDSGPQRFYRTGDLGRQSESGDLEYLGRNDQQVKIRGFRIELGEIETVLREHPSVRDAAVTARESAHGQILLACVVPRESTADRSTEAELRRHLSGRMPGHMVPRRFRFIEELPLTLSGKLDRRALLIVSHPAEDNRP